MSMAKRVIARPVTWLVVFALVVGLGAYMLTLLPVNQFPEIQPPIIMISCSYQQAAPGIVEWNVTRILEGSLANVSGVTEINSTSSKGSSMVMLSFDWGTDLTEATNDVRDNLERVRNALPDEADSPRIFKFDPSSVPILRLVVLGDRSREELYRLAEETIQSRIERIEGVATTTLRGGRRQVVRVEPPLDRLEAYGVSLNSVASALAVQNSEGSGGKVSEGRRDLAVSTAGDFRSLEDIANTVVSYKGHETVLLRDLCDPYWGYTDVTNIVYVNGEPGVYISVQKQSGSNSIEVADRVRGQLQKINAMLPSGVELRVVMDTTTMVRDSMSQVTSSAWQGIALTVLVLLPFLRRVRSTLIVVVSIPVSVMATVIGMYFLGISFNMVSLTGIILALGMVLDGSIVVLENIQHYREKGSKLATAAMLGTREMMVAIIASNLTTICVFLPLVIFQNRLEMIGQIMKDLSFTVVLALTVSLAVAVILVPVMATYVFPVYTSKQRPLRHPFLKRLDDSFARGFDRLQAVYKRALAFVMGFRWTTVIVVLAVLAGAFALVPRVGFQFTPQARDDTLEIDVKLPPGTSLARTREVMRRLEEVTRSEVKGWVNLISTSGSGGRSGSGTSNVGNLEFNLDLSRGGDDSLSAQRKLRAHYGEFPDATFSISGFRGFGGGSEVEVSIYCDDLGRALETAGRIKGLIQKDLPEVVEARVDTDSGLPQLEVAVDRRKAFDLGASMSTVTDEVAAAMAGTTATVFRYHGEEYDVLVTLPEADRKSAPDLERIFTITNTGRKAALAGFVELKKSTGPVSIRRENQKRIVKVTGALSPGAKADRVDSALRSLVAGNIVQDEELSIDFTGSMSDLNKTGQGLIAIAAMALILVFGVMAAQFQSFKDPLIVLIAIPLLFIGVIWVYAVSGEPFNILSGIGIVVLIGIVVNNGIVLVNYTNLLCARGMKVREACVEAGGNRLRPILMTSFTTILAMTPMAFFPGPGSEQVKPIGVTVIGGLTTSTFITLFFVPVLYSLFNEHRRRARRGASQ